MAVVLVVISPNSWLWLTRWGFYAETTSYVFVPFAILFFDLFLDNVIENKKGWQFKIGVLGTILFSYLSFMSHFLALASLIVFFIVYTLIRFLLSSDKKVLIKRLFGYGIVFMKGVSLF
jgi:hypothetical protein